MHKPIKTEIYEDRTFFGDYLESTSEKSQFVELFLKQLNNGKIESLLDLGCYDGTLTQKLALRLSQTGQKIKRLTAIDPAAGPLNEFRNRLGAQLQSAQWQLINMGMESFLAQNKEVFDWVLASHSLYWMGDSQTLIPHIIKSAQSGAIVIRDRGLLHHIEEKYRPRITQKTKRFISSHEISAEFKRLGVDFKTESFVASMAVPPPETLEFKQLAGFLLDLTIEELDENQLPELYADLKVEKGRATYGIDVLWFGETIKI